MKTWTKEVITRKPHNCWGCSSVIPAKSKATRVAYVDEYGFTNSYWCPVCDLLWSRHLSDDTELRQGEIKSYMPEEWSECEKEIVHQRR